MWYVIQTMSGEEEELIQIIGKTIPKALYGECFFPKYENVWKSHGINVKIEPLFRGYLFIQTKEPEALFLELRKTPKLSKILASGDKNSQYAFLALSEEEEEFLSNMLGDDPEHIVRRTYVERSGAGRIEKVEGPLRPYLDKLVKVDFKNRRAFIELEFLGEVRRIKLGLRLPEDEASGTLRMGPVSFDPMDIAEGAGSFRDKAQELEKQKQTASPKRKIKPGSQIKVVRGPYQGMFTAAASVDEKKHTVKVAMAVFGRRMQVELEMEDVEVVIQKAGTSSA